MAPWAPAGVTTYIVVPVGHWAGGVLPLCPVLKVHRAVPWALYMASDVIESMVMPVLTDSMKRPPPATLN